MGNEKTEKKTINRRRAIYEMTFGWFVVDLLFNIIFHKVNICIQFFEMNDYMTWHNRERETYKYLSMRRKERERERIRFVFMLCDLIDNNVQIDIALNITNICLAYAKKAKIMTVYCYNRQICSKKVNCFVFDNKKDGISNMEIQHNSTEKNVDE